MNSVIFLLLHFEAKSSGNDKLLVTTNEQTNKRMNELDRAGKLVAHRATGDFTDRNRWAMVKNE